MEEEKEKYKEELRKLIEEIDEFDLLKYLYIFCKGKAEWYYEQRS